ncbi:hypothetical protein DFP72DRAFT_223028 [Ephemerocybe angulata]|uniref:Uncharacterized protein n=1 Tax=Ephemerocybe angulata TaxID=980116 RepID=A0A8H6M7I3_9AGAR|nr:hypothetical protein DFP72DRAFT_223028 [Tulosesus angulatus]
MGAMAQTTPTTNKNTKRKRQLATPKVSKTALPTTTEEGDLEGNLGDVASTSTLSGTGTGVGGWAEATPNPRLRKQVRRQAQFEHEGDDDLDEDDQDVEMESPTRLNFTSGTRNAHTSPSREAKGKGRERVQNSHQQEEHVPPLRVRLFRPSTSHEDVQEGVEAGAMGSVGKARAGRKKPPIPPYEPPGDVFTPPREVTVSPPHTEARWRNKQAPRSSTTITVRARRRRRP